jgi:hypothetical protein
MASFEVIREPSARYWYTWTPALIRAAEIAANSGNLRLAADLCEWMMGDDRLMAVLDTRSDALLGLPFELLPVGDGRKSGAQSRAARGLGRLLSRAGDQEAPRVGHRPRRRPRTKRLGRERRARRLLPHLEVWSPRWLSWDWEKNSWMVEVAGADGVAFGTSKIPITPGDGEWILYTPSGASGLGCTARIALSRAGASSSSTRSRTSASTPSASARASGSPRRAVPRRRHRHEGAAQGARRRHPGARPQQSASLCSRRQSLKLVESVARSQESFKLQVELADNGTAVSILGQNLTTQAGTGGTIGAASQHGKTQHGRTRMDGKTIPNCLRSQSIVFWAEYNSATAVSPRNPGGTRRRSTTRTRRRPSSSSPPSPTGTS